MKLRNYIWLLIALLVTGCYTDDFFESNKDAFYKLYGNGTRQEAVAMELTDEGDIYLIGNQYVRNQEDSSAVMIMRTDGEGRQRWSFRHFGKGYSQAKAMLELPATNEILLLAASGHHKKSHMVPVLYRLDAAGKLVDSVFLEPESDSEDTTFSRGPVDMVLGEDHETVFVLANMQDTMNVSKYFIKKIDIRSGEVLDGYQTSSHNEMTEGRQLFRRGNQFLVIGNTWQEKEVVRNQGVFMALHAPHLVEANYRWLEHEHNNTIHKAIVSSLDEFVILSSEKVQGTAGRKALVSFVKFPALDISRQVHLDYNSREATEGMEEDEEGNPFVALEEDEEGFLYAAFTTLNERGNTTILINKFNHSGMTVWDAPREIKGEGRDRIVQMSMTGGYIYLLKTLDMQNENTLISLSKIRL